jgi:hypothetical protein
MSTKPVQYVTIQKLAKNVKKLAKVSKRLSKNIKICQKVGKSWQKVVKKGQKIVKNQSKICKKMFLKNLSIICPFAQIVRGRRRRRRRLMAPRPGGDFVAPGKNQTPACIAKY